jgi:hypothetical protein
MATYADRSEYFQIAALISMFLVIGIAVSCAIEESGRSCGKSQSMLRPPDARKRYPNMSASNASSPCRVCIVGCFIRFLPFFASGV